MKNLKNLLAILLIAVLCMAGTALAESTIEANGTTFTTLFEDGEFIIQVDSKGDLGWIADDMAQDPSVVQLAFSDTLEDTFVARYTPVGDGDVTVAVRHYTGIACDQLVTFDLHVENGAVESLLGGSNAATPADEQLDAGFLGQWLEQDTQFTEMTVEKNPERGWDVEIVSPLSHGAYVFKTTVQFDCELNAFVYDKGKFWEVPITDSDEEVELGEAAVAGTTGQFAFVDDENLALEWYDDSQENTVVFEPFDAGAAD